MYPFSITGNFSTEGVTAGSHDQCWGNRSVVIYITDVFFQDFHQNLPGIILVLSLPNSEHLGPAARTRPLCSWLSVFHGYGFCIFHFTLSTTFHDASIFWLRVGLQNRVFLL